MLGRKSKIAVAEELEAQRVDRILGQAQLLTAAARHDRPRVAVEQLAQLRHVALDHLRRARRRLLAPETLDQPANGDGRVRAPRCSQHHAKEPAVETTTHNREAPASAPAPQDAATRAAALIDSRRPRRPSRSELHGCAREGCLEIAQQQADYCPLHN
jgi:hypothetical protein